MQAKRKPGSHITYYRECRKVWGSEPSHSKGNSHFGRSSPEILENDFRGQNSTACDFFYIIEKLLEGRCLKWARITHLDIWNTSYGQKKGRESNCQFDFRPKKVGNRPDSLVCRWRATYCWKALDEGYNFALDRILIRGLLAKLWGSKVARVPTWAKSHLDVGPVERCRVYYKGESGGFP